MPNRSCSVIGLDYYCNHWHHYSLLQSFQSGCSVQSDKEKKKRKTVEKLKKTEWKFDAQRHQKLV